MLGFGKKPTPPVFDLALYDDDVPHDGLCTRRDVPGYTTFLMERTGSSSRSVDDDRLKELGVSREQAWEAALEATRRVAQGLDDSVAEHVPGLVVIGGTEHNAIASALVHWNVRPERHGAAGAFVSVLEKHLALALKVDAPGGVGDALQLFVGLLDQQLGGELDGVRVLWKDAAGWELITLRVSGEELDIACSDRMQAMVQATP